MRKIDEVRYYKMKEIEAIMGISYQKLYAVIELSDELEARGGERIPQTPIIIYRVDIIQIINWKKSKE